MAISAQELEEIIRQNFPNATIKVTAFVDDGEHYSLEIADSSFASMNLISQHRKVKEALKDVLGGKLHAITIKTISHPLNI